MSFEREAHFAIDYDFANVYTRDAYFMIDLRQKLPRTQKPIERGPIYYLLFA